MARPPLRPDEQLKDVPVVELRLADFALYALWAESLDADPSVGGERRGALPW